MDQEVVVVCVVCVSVRDARRKMRAIQCGVVSSGLGAGVGA
jgi:hypothetical protein